MHHTVNGKEVARKYTHVNDDSLVGFVDFLVKIYHPSVHPDFPDGGVFTPHFDRLKISKFFRSNTYLLAYFSDETMKFSGPVGRIQYLQNGHFRVRDKGSQEEREARVKRLAMIAGIGSCLNKLIYVFRRFRNNSSVASDQCRA